MEIKKEIIETATGLVALAAVAVMCKLCFDKGYKTGHIAGMAEGGLESLVSALDSVVEKIETGESVE